MQIVLSTPRSTPVVPSIIRQQPKIRIEAKPEIFFFDKEVCKDDIKIDLSFAVKPYKVSTAPVYQQYTAWRFAKILMGQNYYGPEEFEEEFPLFFLTHEDLCTIAQVPWTKEILESPCPFFEGKMVKETHLLTMNQVFYGSEYAYWFEWNLVVKNPPTIKPTELPAHYGIRRAIESGEDILRKIIARHPQK